MKCPKCGSEVKPNYKFCTKCGQPMPVNNNSISQEISTKGMVLNTPINTVQTQSISQNTASEKAFGFGNSNKPNTQQEAPALTRDVADKIDMVRGKAVWNIGPGQLARRISETEFAELDNLKGIVIQEGVTAVVSIDGQFMAMLKGGYYKFANEKVVLEANTLASQQEVEDKETEGLLQKTGRSALRVWRFLTGTLDQEKAEDRQRRQERVKRNIQKLTSNSLVNISLVNTRIFELIFGSNLDAQGHSDFVPMKVRTKVVDIDMGVTLQMQVTNISDFLINYLSDRSSLSVVDIQSMVQPAVETLLNRVLRNLDYQAEGLPEELVAVLRAQIQKSINDRLYGIEVFKVLDITDQSADFDRFRAVEHELFATEQELGYLQRTGEFRNRLAVETNAQEVQQANTEEDLRYALSKVNRDGLLHDDEMEAFVQLLNSQKRLREAKTEEQEYEALQDMRKCRLVKDEDMNVLENMLQNKELERNEATELLRLRVFQSTEEARLKAENALSDLAMQQAFKEDEAMQAHTQSSELSAAKHNVEMADYDIQAQRKRDDYDFEQQQRDYSMFRQQQADAMQMSQQQAEFERQQRRADKMDDMDILERKAAIARANMQQMQQHEQLIEEMKHQNEALRIQTEATMTHEQIAAAHMQDIAGLDAAAQSEMARMMGAGKTKEAEMLRQQQERERMMYEQMMQMQQQNMQTQQQAAGMNQQQMMQMMQMMMHGMTQMGQNQTMQQQNMFNQQQAMQQQRYNDMQQMKDEYRENSMHQQQRMDHTQDSALRYTSNVTESAHDNNSTLTMNTNITTKTVFCPACGGRAITGGHVCPHCGEPLV